MAAPSGHGNKKSHDAHGIAFPHPVIVVCSVTLADKNREAASESLCKAYYHEAETSDGTKCGKGLHSHKTADNYCVNH